MDKINVFVSNDESLRNKKVKDFLSQFPESEIINADDDINLILQELDTNSFFEDKKVIYVASPTFLTTFTEDEFKKINKYFENPGDNILVISVNELKDNKVTKALKNVAKIYSIEERTKKNLKKYIADYFSSLMIKIDEECIDYIVENALVETIDVELDKLSTYAMSSRILLKPDIEVLLVKNTDSKIYDLTSSIIERDKNKIMKIYNDLLNNNEDVFRIINSISYKFEELMQVKDLVSQGSTPDDVAKAFRVSPGRAYHMVKDSKRVTFENIRGNIIKLSNLDYQAKSGLINPKIGLEMYLLD